MRNTNRYFWEEYVTVHSFTVGLFVPFGFGNRHFLLPFFFLVMLVTNSFLA